MKTVAELIDIAELLDQHVAAKSKEQSPFCINDAINEEGVRSAETDLAMAMREVFREPECFAKFASAVSRISLKPGR